MTMSEFVFFFSMEMLAFDVAVYCLYRRFGLGWSSVLGYHHSCIRITSLFLDQCISFTAPGPLL